MKLFFRALALVCIIVHFSGCNGAKKNPAVMPQVGPAQDYHDASAHRTSNPGSLFDNTEAEQLFADSRARRVGDLVVVKITEQTAAQTKADTSSQKNGANSYGIGSFFGQSEVYMVPIANYNPPGVKSVRPDPTYGRMALDTLSSSTMNGTGQTKRENNVRTSMAVRVTRVMPGGLLQIEGARETRVNEETEYMVLTGVIRSRDVAADNSILSTQVADLGINYYGKGVIADKQKPGWFSRLMDNIWPF
ncbi:MAG: flagellar basal body L-ring protein FlgH [Deltaproteobacteria bacterium]|jgi:flagellar L-ring protein precursor FlgH|nr:flagellar basal body L-ring protein FlgH [Deltaproteobacteria bacterium]